MSENIFHSIQLTFMVAPPLFWNYSHTFLHLPKRGRIAVEPQFNKPLRNEVLGVMNDFLQPGQNYNELNGTELSYNEPQFKDILSIMNTIQKSKRKIYPNVTNKCQHMTER